MRLCAFRFGGTGGGGKDSFLVGEGRDKGKFNFISAPCALPLPQFLDPGLASPPNRRGRPRSPLVAPPPPPPFFFARGKDSAASRQFRLKGGVFLGWGLLGLLRFVCSFSFLTFVPFCGIMLVSVGGWACLWRGCPAPLAAFGGCCGCFLVAFRCGFFSLAWLRVVGGSPFLSRLFGLCGVCVLCLFCGRCPLCGFVGFAGRCGGCGSPRGWFVRGFRSCGALVCCFFGGVLWLLSAFLVRGLCRFLSLLLWRGLSLPLSAGGAAWPLVARRGRMLSRGTRVLPPLCSRSRRARGAWVAARSRVALPRWFAPLPRRVRARALWCFLLRPALVALSLRLRPPRASVVWVRVRGLRRRLGLGLASPWSCSPAGSRAFPPRGVRGRRCRARGLAGFGLSLLPLLCPCFDCVLFLLRRGLWVALFYFLAKE